MTDDEATTFECEELLNFVSPYRFWNCNLDVSKARALGQSIKFTSKLHSIE